MLLRTSTSQRGFSMVEIVISMGILGIMALVTMKLIDTQAQNEAMARSQGEIAKTMALLQASINDRDRCQMMFAGRGVNPPEYVSQLVYITQTQMKVLLAGESQYQDFRVDSIGLKQSTMISKDVADVDVTFSIERKGINFFQSSNRWVTMRKTISFVYSADANNKIKSCGPAVGDANLLAKQNICLNLGAAATWDPGTGACRLNTIQCPVGQIPEKMIELGNLECKPLRNNVVLNDFFDISAAGINCAGRDIRLDAVSGGKIRLICP